MVRMLYCQGLVLRENNTALMRAGHTRLLVRTGCFYSTAGHVICVKQVNSQTVAMPGNDPDCQYL